VRLQDLDAGRIGQAVLDVVDRAGRGQIATRQDGDRGVDRYGGAGQ
jgi:hypothetical protein